MTQLSLIDTPRSWRLDEHTRSTGRAGIARARAALAAGIESRVTARSAEARKAREAEPDAASRRPPPRRRPGRRPTRTGAPERRRAAA
jgi:hypothetical protein